MTSLTKKLHSWADRLPYWERAALHLIVSGVPVDEVHVDRLVEFLLQDEGLAPADPTRPEIRFSTEAAPPTDGSKRSPRPRLKAIRNLEGVNALAPSQELTFSPNLTIVYGPNGAGKSGYSRVLGRLGFTRGDQELLPNVSAEEESTQTVEVELEGSTPRRLDLSTQSVVSGLYVFDHESVTSHLSGTTRFSFSPRGITQLSELAELTDRVRRRLRERVRTRATQRDFTLLFGDGDSPVLAMVRDIGPDSDLEQLRALASLSEEEEARRVDLTRAIATRVADRPEDRRALLHRHRADVNKLGTAIEAVMRTLSGDAITAASEARAALSATLAEAAELSAESFAHAGVDGVGGSEWRAFVAAAARLAGQQQPGYPQEQSVCLLCHQPLSEDARRLLGHLWEFLNAEAEQRVTDARRELGRQMGAISSLDLRFFSEDHMVHGLLVERDGKLAAEVQAFVAEASEVRQAALSALASSDPVPTLGVEPPNLSAVIATLDEELRQLDQPGQSDGLDELRTELRQLEHRRVLARHVHDIDQHVSDLRWARDAGAVGGTTHHITAKHNELFDELVTDAYVDRFSRVLSVLNRPLHVSVRTGGRKGESFRRLVLTEAAQASQVSPAEVLSEGEKRIVALADCLAEATLDPDAWALVFDDPVTSLDLEWREQVATLLAEESTRRQVIVFSHDLPFVYHLTRASGSIGIQPASHWIDRRGEGDPPGWVFLDNSPAVEKDYRHAQRARELYARSKDAAPADRQAILRDGFGALRTSYEALVIFELLNEVVVRFGERLSMGRLRGIAWDNDLAREIVEKFEEISGLIEGHLSSDAYAGSPPTSERLLEEVEHFEALKKRIKEMKK